MSHIKNETQQIRETLLPIIGETFAKTYFSYYGIFKDNLMFALYKNGEFYLKLSPEDVLEATSINGIECLIDLKLSQTKHYYFIPNHILTQLERYQHWLKNSLANAKNNKYQPYYKKKNQIRALPNMNINFERMLKKINIFTVEEFFSAGEINIFVEFIKIGIEANEETLFKLYGAINHQLIYTLSPKTKRELLQMANDALYKAGLRRRFKI